MFFVIYVKGFFGGLLIRMVWGLMMLILLLEGSFRCLGFLRCSMLCVIMFYVIMFDSILLLFVFFCLLLVMVKFEIKVNIIELFYCY
jgi:hypothetical protein